LAHAAAAPCLTPGEFSALSSYALPSVITGTAQRCGASLPSQAYLKANGSQLAARYAGLRQSAWPGARAALVKVAPAINPEAATLMAKLPDETLQQIADAWVESLVAQQLPVERCASVDRLVRLLAPLPPENTAELVALAVGLGAKAGVGRVGKLEICAG
ncbi:MAG: hypothetical protein WCY11_12275, partial [Novosphingobium sp.]